MRSAFAGALAAGLVAGRLFAASGPAVESTGPRVVRAAVGSPVRVSAAALLVSGMTGGRFAVAVAPVLLPSGAADREDSVARILLTIDVRPSVLEEIPDPWDLEVVSYALTPDDVVVASSSLAVEIDREAVEPSAFDGLQVIDDLLLEPGDYVVRVLVRERSSGELGLVSAELEVPRPSARAGPQALWLLRPAAGWILALAAPEAGGFDPRTAPSAEPATEWIPAPFGELVPGALGRALLRVPTPPGAASPGEVTATFRDAFGDLVTTAPVRLAPPLVGSAPAEAWIADFTVPPLPPGVHSVSFTVTGRETARLAFATAGGAGPVAGASAPTVAAVASPREASALYEGALAAWAAGDEEAARAALRGLEEDVLEDGRSGFRQWLMRAEQDVIGRLAGAAPTALPAVLDLHAALLADYGAAGEATLEGHTMQVLLRVAAALERRAAPADRPRAAAALARAGAGLQQGHWLPQAERLLAQAIDFDGGNRAALLGLAAAREKSEDYAGAVRLLEALVEHHPEDEEGRLRLAVNLARVTRTARALELLRALAPKARTRWISIVAYQELARLESTGDRDRARATLASALDRWPGEQGLTLQRLVLYDRRWPGDRAEVPGELLRAPRVEPAPRAQYNRWPRPAPGADVAGRRALARWLEERRP